MCYSKLYGSGGKRLGFLQYIVVLTGVLLAFSRAEVVIDGDFSDWATIGQESATAPVVEVTDPSDLGDSSGDLAKVTATVEGENLILTFESHGATTPTEEETPEGKTNRYYYHWLIDTDNNPATGVSNATYENEPTGIVDSIGTEIIIQFGWRNGATDGVYAYSPLDPDEAALVSDFAWEKIGNTLQATIPYEPLGIVPGQTVSVSSFQEGASDGWAVDFMESAEIKIPASGGGGVSAPVVEVTDPSDLEDSSGDLAKVTATVEGENLVLTFESHGATTPTEEETPEGKINRYYYHWLIDTDNNPATGVSNATYENEPTGIVDSIGTEIIIQFGWRNGATDGVYAYSPLDPDETALVSDFPWEKVGNALQATIPYEPLGLVPGQTVSISSFQEGASDGWAVDFMESVEIKIPASGGGGGENTNIAIVDDSVDDLLDPNGDLKQIRATTDGVHLYLGMTVEGDITPKAEDTPDGLTNRHYYHWLIDADNNPVTGVSNATYENEPTGIERIVGSEIVIQIGWRDGAPDGINAYDPTDPDERAYLSEFEWAATGDSFEAKLPLEALELSVGQKVSFSAFQEGASDGWATDWIESAELALTAPGSVGGTDLSKNSFVNGYGFTVILEDGDAVVDADGVTALLDGAEVAVTATKDGALTTVTGTYSEPLRPGSEHALRLQYGDGVTEIPVITPEYTVIPSTYGVASLDDVPRGLTVNVTQISEAQADSSSAHGQNLEKAEQQLAGNLLSVEGKPFYNEASDSKNGWVAASTMVEGIINWSEDAPTDAGYFGKLTTNQTDVEIPLIPGSGNSTSGLVIEVLAYLELEAGYHRLGINTIGGYQASMGPDGRDRLAPVLGSYEDAVRYSFLGDKYFDVLAPEAGFYPIRVLFTHSERTEEGASMEFFSLKEARRIAINDPDDSEAIKAYQFIAGDATYVSRVFPTPGTDFARPNTSVDLVIEQGGAQVVAGSVSMSFDGAPVTPSLSTEGSALEVRYFPGALDFASSHEVEIAYTLDLDPPLERRETFDFGVYRGATVLPPAWGTPVANASEPGFSARVVQDPGPRGSSISEAEKQLAGQGTFTATKTVPVINFGGSGLFDDDFGFLEEELIGEESSDYFSMEVLTHLHLKPGAYTFGVNSDDGFAASVGVEATDRTLMLDGWDTGRGIDNGEPQDLYDVVVRQEGIYAFRLMYFQGFGSAAVEWYQYDRDTETATLLNTEGAPTAYVKRNATPEAFAGPRISAPTQTDLGAIPLSVGNVISGFIVHNTGTEALTITRADVSGPQSGNFVLTDYPRSVAGGEAGLFKVTFDPKGVPGGYVATLELDTNDPDQATLMIELSAGALDPVGPIAHYALDESEGDVLRDRSGNQRDGIFAAGNGTLALGQAALATGSAVGFSGGSRASVSGAEFAGWEDFTLAVWIKADAIAEAPQMIFGKGEPGGGPNFALLFSSAGLQWFVGSEQEFASEPDFLQADTAHHVTVSFLTTGDARVASIYVDGQMVVEQTDPNFIATGVNEPLYLGSFDGAVALAGVLDDVQLYDRALGAADVMTLFQNPGVPLTGTVDPGPTTDVPVLATVQWSDNGLQTAFQSQAGVTYELEYSEDLTPGSWSVVATVEGDGGTKTFADSDATRNGMPAGFYRVQVK